MNGKQAIEKAMERTHNKCCKKYALILMDINMPIMDGVAATKILKEKMALKLLEKTPIVAVSAAKCESEEDRAQYIEAGFDDFSTLIFSPFPIMENSHTKN